MTVRSSIIGVVALATMSALAVVLSSPVGAAAIPFSSSPGTVDVAGSATFTVPLQTVFGSDAVVYTASPITSTPVGLQLSSDGSEIETIGTLDVGSYTLSGTDSDSPGTDGGSWTYTLDVTGDAISQGAPLTNIVSVSNSAVFTDQLVASTGFAGAGAVTFTTSTSSSPSGLSVSSSGAVTTSGRLAAAVYTISGTDTDAYGDSGSWAYALTVSAVPIAQSSPSANAVSLSRSSTFADQLAATPGFTDSVAFSANEPSSPPGLTVSSSGGVTTTGTLAATTYTISGTDSDAYGDGGNWTYTLTVTAGKVTLVQSSPTNGTVTSTASGTFTSGPVTVEGNVGPVTYQTVSPSSALAVSSSGLISTTGVLAIGSYTVSGTDSDVGGEKGSWTFTLIVTGTVVTVSFDANGGSGTMASESESAPTALVLNSFTRPRHTFVDWNTAANGSGESYANGAVFPFTEPMTLFAQWKVGKAPFHSIVFAANGGKGSMSIERANTPTAISANRFTRAGYTFVDWSSAANGSGKRYNGGAVFPFRRSAALYAQWKKNPVVLAKVVTFVANGGTGAMNRERRRQPASLTRNRFTRKGFIFVDWNTSANGSGSAIANGAIYPFSVSTTLYAQWRRVESPPPPVATPSWSTIGPFARGSSALSATIDNWIRKLAERVKSNGSSQISLVGYGDALTQIQEKDASLVDSNVALGRERAGSVATYLQGRLTALGLTGWTISIAADSPATSNSVEATFVIAALK